MLSMIYVSMQLLLMILELCISNTVLIIFLQSIKQKLKYHQIY